jgi:hypothetical protein
VYGWRRYLVLWWFRASLAWLWARVPFRSSRDDRYVPGLLLVTTTSMVARNAIEKSFAAQSGAPYRVRDVLLLNDLEESWNAGKGASEEDWTMAGTQRFERPVSWQVRLSPGGEAIVLRELEFRVATALARVGDYAHVSYELKLEMARQAMAASRVRQVFAARTPRQRRLRNTFEESVPIEVEQSMHSTYRDLIIGDAPTEPVTVAVFDTAINPQHVWTNIDDRFELGPSMRNRRAGAHGAVTASIVADLVPTARIVSFPVIGPPDADGTPLKGESLVAYALKHTSADVVVMALSLPEPAKGTRDEDRYNLAIDMAAVGENCVIVVATGNGSAPADLRCCFPSTMPGVLAVGAVNAAKERPSYSRCEFDDGDEPGLFLLAPGGDETPGAAREFSVRAEQVPVTGTSVAAAYAAAVVARAKGTPAAIERNPTAGEMLVALRKAADRSYSPSTQLCKGVIHQPTFAINIDGATTKP